MNNLVKIRKSKNLSQKKLAELSGLSPGHLGDIEVGKTKLTENTIKKLSKALGVTPEELTNTDSLNNKISLKIKLFSHRLSAGTGIKLYDINKEYNFIDIDKDFLELMTKVNPNNLGLFLVMGDSMSPQIDDKDLIFVDESVKTVENDGVYAIVYNNDFYVKKIQKLPNQLLLISNNPQYHTIEIPLPPKYELQVIGKVVCNFIKRIR